MPAGKITCPGCGQGMEEITVRGIPLDRCQACRGLWFDEGEFVAAAACAVPPLQVGPPSDRDCPACGTRMRQAKLGPVLVERCVPRLGLFLDAGELETIRRRRPPLPTRPRTSYASSGSDSLQVLLSLAYLVSQ